MLSPRSSNCCVLLMAFVFFSWGVCKGVDPTVEPTFPDEEEEVEVPSTHVPRFISKPLSISVLQGESANFPCDVDDLGTFATVWRKGENDLLFANSIRIMGDANYQRLEDRSLQVRRARPKDDGYYLCIISSNPRVELKHTLTVLIPPKITSKHKNHITITKGQPLNLNCEASGTPAPTITWKLLDGVFSDGRTIHEGGAIYTAESTRHQAGTYECIASNGVGDPDTYVIRVHVYHSPEVEPVSSWVHAGDETSADLTCRVQAHPVADVVWKKDPSETVITESEHYHMKSSGGEHSLHIMRMKEEDFGDYLCQASNREGTNSATITVSGLASPAEFKSDPHGDLPHVYVLKWNTRSHSPVIDYTLRIKPQKDGATWRELRVSPDDQQSPLKSQSYEVTDLEAATPYEAIVTVLNKFGSSQPSRHFVFYTQGSPAAPHKEVQPVTQAEATDHGPSQSPAQPQQQDPNGMRNGDATSRTSALLSVIIIILTLVFAH